MDAIFATITVKCRATSLHIALINRFRNRYTSTRTIVKKARQSSQVFRIYHSAHALAPVIGPSRIRPGIIGHQGAFTGVSRYARLP